MSPVALFFLITTPALYALTVVLIKKGSAAIPPFAIIATSTFVLFVGATLLSVAFERSFQWTSTQNRAGLYYVMLAGLVNIVAFWCFIKAMEYVPVWQVEMFGLLSPIFAGVLAYLIIGEALSSQLFIGLAVVSVGMFIAVR